MYGIGERVWHWGKGCGIGVIVFVFFAFFNYSRHTINKEYSWKIILTILKLWGVFLLLFLFLFFINHPQVQRTM